MKALLLIFFLALLAPASFGLLESANHSCPSFCMPMGSINWTINLSNRGEEQITVTKVEIMNRDTLEIIASKYANATVYKTLIVNLEGVVPDSSFHYKVCYTTLLSQESRLYEDTYYGLDKTFCELKNRSVEVKECTENNHCTFNATCFNSTCTPLACDFCAYAKNHECLSYECCSNDACAGNEACVQKTCQALDCAYNESIINHACMPLYCESDQELFNKTCRKLECGEFELAQNGICKKLECKDNEFVSNKTCLTLTCLPTEKSFNHSCIALECKENERAANHACEKINCLPHQSLRQKKCEFDSIKIYSILEIPLMILILAAVILLAKRALATIEQAKKKSEAFYKEAEKIVKK